MLEVFFCPELLSEDQAAGVLSGLNDRASVYTVPEPLLKMLAYRDEPEGIIAVVRQPVWTLDDLQAVRGGGAGDLYLIAVGTAKPGNLGAMARSAEAAGCKAVLACGTPVDAFNPQRDPRLDLRGVHAADCERR